MAVTISLTIELVPINSPVAGLLIFFLALLALFLSLRGFRAVSPS